MSDQLIRNATIVTMDDEFKVLDRGDVLISDGLVADVGPGLDGGAAEETDATGLWLLPGFVQPHVHLCQTLFRGLAEEMGLMEWLRTRIWPMEAAHDPRSLSASVRLGIRELIASGTTCALDMGTAHHTDVVFDEAAALGIRLYAGKAMMEMGKGLPEGLMEEPGLCLRSAVELARRHHNTESGRLGYVFCPRFLISVSKELFRDIASEARRLGCRMQTHTSENLDENREVERRTTMPSLRYLERSGFLGPDVSLVHVIHISNDEFSVLAESKSHVVHCPGSNAKLGSGTARVPEMLETAINVSLASDGAPCNNNLSMFKEMRLAGQLQSLRLGPGRLDAQQIVRMATRGGAAAMGLSKRIGSIEKGKKADLVLLDPHMPHSAAPFSDIYTRIVYGMDERNVASTWIDGARIYDGEAVRSVDDAALVAEARRELEKLLDRL
jgi:cytosine/adenosine deaminase-related metal-dependent hydrolase